MTCSKSLDQVVDENNMPGNFRVTLREGYELPPEWVEKYNAQRYYDDEEIALLQKCAEDTTDPKSKEILSLANDRMYLLRGIPPYLAKKVMDELRKHEAVEMVVRIDPRYALSGSPQH